MDGDEQVVRCGQRQESIIAPRAGKAAHPGEGNAMQTGHFPGGGGRPEVVGVVLGTYDGRKGWINRLAGGKGFPPTKHRLETSPTQ